MCINYDDDDTSLNGFNDYYVCTCSESISKKNNHSLDFSSLKRNSSPLGDNGNSIIKKRKTIQEISPYQENIISIQRSVEDNGVLNINLNLTSESKKKNYKCIKSNKVKPELNTGSTTVIKKMFKIPDDFKHKLFQRSFKSVNIPKDDSWSKSNSPVKLGSISKNVGF
ncbi:uncharacterized protein LOC112686164 [Sipha flava]|uniref:Uncharacterized protein LOC112686164 n=1 Tax=Sipha flava TaxID=143950 RepID=A0A8B8FUV9_9HEMI|nr:uncharacterized protein LOC112686164 [Sipha flava]